MSARRNRCLTILATASLVALFCLQLQAAPPQEQCRFVGIKDFKDFTVEPDTNSGQTTLHSPVLKAPIAWNQLVVSWNTSAPADAWFQIEARADYSDHKTKFYQMAL